MIRPSYALKLARTKLRSKRGMLIASITISSLLFAAVITAVIVFTGVQKSAVTFIEKANNGNYLVQVQPVAYQGAIPGSDPTKLSQSDIDKAKAYEAIYYSQLKQQYKALNIEYVEPSPDDSLLTPDAYASPETPEGLRYRLNFNSPLFSKFEQDNFIEYAKAAKNTITDLRKIASNYDGEGFYSAQSFPANGIPSQRVVLGGKEKFSETEMKTGDMSNFGYFTNAVHNSQYGFQDQSLLSRYLTLTDTSKLKGIPVIISAQEAASLFGESKGIGKEPSDSAAKQEWFKQIQQKLTGQTYETCYRNESEQNLLQKIQRDYADIQNNKSKKDYVKPDLIYDYPKSACGDITVKSDTRSKEEKDAEAKSINTQKKLGTYKPPQHKLIIYQMVGFMVAEPYADSTANINSYLKNLLAFSNPLSSSATIPTQMYDKLPDALKLDSMTTSVSNKEYADASKALGTHIVAFLSINQARAFINNETCPSSDLSCKKLFTADPYGSNYLLLEQIGEFFAKFMMYAIPSVLILAVIIIWFTMSRIMADNRRETAIFRAMGAKRHDIAAIYLTYTLIIALRMALASLVVGIAGAWLIDASYGQQISAVAAASFGVQGESTPHFSLFEMSSPLVVLIPGGIFVVCLLAVAYPLLKNVKRSPIHDMREE